MIKASYLNKTAYLSEEKLLPQDKSCPFCSSTNRKNTAILQRSPDIYLMLCKNCYAVSASRMPKGSALNEYYGSYYGETKIATDIPEKLAEHIYLNTQKFFHKKRNIKILDFGGGNGEISISLARNFIKTGISSVDVALVDYTDEIKKALDEKIKIKHYYNLSQIKEDKFNIVISSAVIEHIPYPISELNILFNALEEGGIFYARTPYMIPFMKLSGKLGIKFDFTYPGHIHDLGQNFWNNILDKLNLNGEFELIVSKPSIIETGFRNHFFRTLLAYIFKSPWYILRERYNLVGGWEVFIRKI